MQTGILGESEEVLMADSIQATDLEECLASETLSKDVELDRIAKRIESLVDQAKGLHPKFLVSALGIALGEDLKTLKQLTNGGLNDFIESSRLSHRFKLERMGIHGNITAVVDRSVSPVTLQSATSPREQNPRFHPRFWAAFSVPSKVGHVRILSPDDFTFKDVPSEDEPKGGWTIAEYLIVSAQEDRRDDKIKANIATWLNQNALNEDRFQVSKKTAARSVHSQTGSLLEALISALDRRQLQANTLTLDAVATLLRTPRG